MLSEDGMVRTARRAEKARRMKNEYWSVMNLSLEVPKEAVGGADSRDDQVEDCDACETDEIYSVRRVEIREPAGEQQRSRKGHTVRSQDPRLVSHLDVEVFGNGDWRESQGLKGWERPTHWS